MEINDKNAEKLPFVQHIPCDMYLTIIWDHVTVFHSFKSKRVQALDNKEYNVTAKSHMIRNSAHLQ